MEQFRYSMDASATVIKFMTLTPCTIQQLLAIVKSSKPKITKWIEEETDGESDRIGMARDFQFNCV